MSLGFARPIQPCPCDVWVGAAPRPEGGGGGAFGPCGCSEHLCSGCHMAGGTSCRPGQSRRQALEWALLAMELLMAQHAESGDEASDIAAASACAVVQSPDAEMGTSGGHPSICCSCPSEMGFFLAHKARSKPWSGLPPHARAIFNPSDQTGAPSLFKLKKERKRPRMKIKKPKRASQADI